MKVTGVVRSVELATGVISDERVLLRQHDTLLEDPTGRLFDRHLSGAQVDAPKGSRWLRRVLLESVRPIGYRARL